MGRLGKNEQEKLPAPRKRLGGTGTPAYDVLACVPTDKIEALRQQVSAAGVPISEIGVVAAGEGGARFLGMDGEPLVFARTSFSHF